MKTRPIVWPLLLAAAFSACSSSSVKATASSTTDRPVARAASSEAECGEGTTLEIEACTVREFTRVDRERARVAAQLVSSAVQPELLQPFSGTLPNLENEWREAELAFLSYRDHACEGVSVARYPGTSAGIAENTCKISLTHAHIAFLRAALEGKGNFP